MKKEKNNSQRLRLVGRFLQGSKALFAVSVLCALIASLADMITPQIIRVAVDNVITQSAGELNRIAAALVNMAGGVDYLREHIIIMAAAVVAVAVVKVASQYGFQLLEAQASETMMKTMRDMLFSHIQKLPFSWHMKNRTGDIIQRCTSDIDMIKNFVSEQLTNVLRTVIMLVLAFVFMFSTNVQLSLIALIPIPFIIGYSLLFHRKIEQGFIKCDENEGKLSAMVQENLTGVRVVRAFGQERTERDKFEAHNEYYTGLWEHLARVMSRFWSTSDILSGLQIMLVVV
ncbi:MAG: ABC transporter ATP-binding protein, partial [Oscillospiraceae bacterium]